MVGERKKVRERGVWETMGNARIFSPGMGGRLWCWLRTSGIVTPSLMTNLEKMLVWGLEGEEQNTHYSTFFFPSIPLPKFHLFQNRDVGLGLKQSRMEAQRDLGVALNCLLFCLTGVFTAQGTSSPDSLVATYPTLKVCFLLNRGCFSILLGSCHIECRFVEVCRFSSAQLMTMFKILQ